MSDKIDERLKFKINQFILEREINRLIQNKMLNEDDERYEIFVGTILPSCLFHHIGKNRNVFPNYMCPFKNCHKLLSRKVFAIRHMREQHYFELPLGVFNKNENDFCDICDAGPFIRKEHFTQHKKSNNHIYKAVKAGRASRNEIDKYNALMESKERSKSLLRKENKENHENSGSNTSESSETSYEYIKSEVSNNKQQSLDRSKNNKRKSGDIQGTPTYSAQQEKDSDSQDILNFAERQSLGCSTNNKRKSGDIQGTPTYSEHQEKDSDSQELLNYSELQFLVRSNNNKRKSGDIQGTPRYTPHQENDSEDQELLNFVEHKSIESSNNNKNKSSNSTIQSDNSSIKLKEAASEEQLEVSSFVTRSSIKINRLKLLDFDRNSTQIKRLLNERK